MFLSTNLRSLSYVTMLFGLINYRNEILQILKLVGWYFFVVVLSTLPFILVLHLVISNYFNEAKSIATDLQPAELYADHNAITYNEIAFKTVIKNNRLVPLILKFILKIFILI